MYISVIIPFFNMEDFIEEAIISVINQSYSTWELLLIDDGSTDKSRLIALKYVHKYPSKIKYLHHVNYINKGLTYSRNLGLRKAKGEYVALLDADDVWMPEKLLEQTKIAKAYPNCALIAGSSIYWYSWKEPSKIDTVIQVGEILEQIVKPPTLIFHLYPIGKKAAPCPSSLLIKTDILKKHNGFEETFKGLYQMYEDQAFLAKFYINENCFISSSAFSKYRQRHGSLVNNVNEEGKYLQVRGFFLNWLQNYLKTIKINNNSIHNAVRLAIFKNKYPHLDQYLKWITFKFNKFGLSLL